MGTHPRRGGRQPNLSWGAAWWAPAPSATCAQLEAAVGTLGVSWSHYDTHTLTPTRKAPALSGRRLQTAACGQIWPQLLLPMDFTGTAEPARVRTAHGGCPAVPQSWVVASPQTAKPNDSAPALHREGVPSPGEGSVPERAALCGSGRRHPDVQTRAICSATPRALSPQHWLFPGWHRLGPVRLAHWLDPHSGRLQPYTSWGGW